MPTEPRIALLVAYFQRIAATQMRDMPILNQHLQVQAIGFQPLADQTCLGILLTPWFMNLIWLSHTQEAFQLGASRDLQLASGIYTLQLNYAEGIGSFYSASLFSPVLQFTDQTSAVLTAEQVLQQLFTPATEPPAQTAATKSAKLSRRDFLRGQFS
jgi:[NiFe] hydrogenase assembly HybE family chaperone